MNHYSAKDTKNLTSMIKSGLFEPLEVEVRPIGDWTPPLPRVQRYFYFFETQDAYVCLKSLENELPHLFSKKFYQITKPIEREAVSLLPAIVPLPCEHEIGYCQLVSRHIYY